MGRGRVRPDQCRGCCNEQHDAAYCLDMQKSMKGVRSLFCQSLSCWQIAECSMVVHRRRSSAWRPDHRVTCRCPMQRAPICTYTERWWQFNPKQGQRQLNGPKPVGVHHSIYPRRSLEEVSQAAIDKRKQRARRRGRVRATHRPGPKAEDAKCTAYAVAQAVVDDEEDAKI